ncbi:MAG: hypothetical protein ACREB7_06620 [Sphingopyxis sp.]|uniref:hypothetical protein n=1 Tax=Sphingopyxis sp. TaxID=1908224 RepID=UPI003D6C9B79
MAYRIEPPLTHKPAEVLRQSFHDIFGRGVAEGDGQGDPSRCYRMAVMIALKVKYGTPMPPSLFALIDEAGFVGVHPDDVADFIGWQFNLTPVRRYRESLST